MKPLVSIIIPCFNREVLIKRALESVLSQTYSNWECLIVDDGSSDGTLEVLERYSKRDSRILYQLRERLPKGAPTCRNIGLNKSRGSYVIFLDSDDYLLPHCLKQRVEAIKSCPENDFWVFPMAEKKRGMIKKRNIPASSDYLIDFLSANLPWQTMCPIWKRPFIIKLNGFTEGYPRFNDPELMIRALLKKETKFKTFNKLEYDSVFMISSKDKRQFKNLIYKSLKLLIPETVKGLKEHQLYEYRFYLLGYLHYWFKYVYIPADDSNVIQSLKLLSLYRTYKVISILKAFNLTIRLFLYSISTALTGKPIDKISDKSLYIITL